MNDAKEKAQELVDKFYQSTPNEAWYNPPIGSLSMEYKAWEQAKQCAIIAANEILYFSKAHGFIELTHYWENVIEQLKSKQ